MKSNRFLNDIAQAIEVSFLVEGDPRIYIVPNTVIVMPWAERDDISSY